MYNTTVSFGSPILGKSVCFNAVIPQGPTEDIPTVYLLHGLSDDFTAWGRFTRIEQYAAEYGFAVIMPDGDRSFYEDMAYGQAYYTHISREIVAESRRLFHLSEKREKTFVAGLSMGGYGAFKLAMRAPEVFSAAGSLSGVTDIAYRVESCEWDNDMKLIFGDDRLKSVRGSDADLFALAEEMAKRSDAPSLIQICGTEDFLYEDNLRFKAHAEALGLPHTYAETPGNHNWDFWDTHIRTVLRFFAEKMK